MNKQSLGALVVLNVVLLAALAVVSVLPGEAQAQARRGRGEYVMIAGKAFGAQDRSIIYILETKKFAMASLVFDGRNKKLEGLDRRDILPDLEGRGRVAK